MFDVYHYPIPFVYIVIFGMFSAMIFFVSLPLFFAAMKSKTESKAGKIFIGITLILSFVSSVVFLILGSTPSHTVEQNVYQIYDNKTVGETKNTVRPNEDKIVETIKDKIKVDKVVLDSDSDDLKSKTINGDPISFTAFKDDEMLDGKFYWTRTSMVIVTADEHNVKNEIEVATN